MKSHRVHHAAALAALGWYLMAPPPDANRQPDESALLTQWTHIAAFDSAKECEDYKVELHDSIEKKSAARAQYEMSFACVASDDWGLKPE